MNIQSIHVCYRSVLPNALLRTHNDLFDLYSKTHFSGSDDSFEKISSGYRCVRGH